MSTILTPEFIAANVRKCLEHEPDLQILWTTRRINLPQLLSQFVDRGTVEKIKATNAQEKT